MNEVDAGLGSQSVCAVIVTYHPTAGMMDNLPKVLEQVQSLVVVDNGSNEVELAPLRELSRRIGFRLLENGENLGLAEALNRGVLEAMTAAACTWVILFDQDSRMTDGFISEMFASWIAHPQRDRIGTMHPRYVDSVTGIERPVSRAPDGGPITSMTSGALMPAWIFDKIGYFAAEYFIDHIDTEYGYRIRSAGFLNADSRKAVLLHSAGFPRRVNFLGFSFEPTHHSATRRYYLSRNRIVVHRKYFRQFPRWIIYSSYIAFRETIKCLLAEQERSRKLRNIILGIRDGLLGRMGKRNGL